jgi:Uma2 family endonuclease
VSFVAKGRLTPRQPRRGFPDMAPDLAVEIRSPDDSWAELREKATEYLAGGSRMVVLVEPDEFVELLRPGEPPLRLGREAALDGGDVLPGFHCQVADLFPPEV